MKKLFGMVALVMMMIATTGYEAKGQLTATAMTKSSDTIAASGTGTLILRVLESREVVSIQVVVTKRYGTLTGKCELWGSNNGTNYVKIATDTLKILNQTTNTYIWVVSPSKYLDYKVITSPLGGSCSHLGYLLRRKNE